MSRDFPATSADQEPRIGHYELLNTTDQGSSDKVRLGRHMRPGTAVAVPVISSQRATPASRGVTCRKPTAWLFCITLTQSSCWR